MPADAWYRPEGIGRRSQVSLSPQGRWHTITAYHQLSVNGAAMSRMSIRSTYALDAKTSDRIKRLAAVWGVSQAEVVRRSVQRAAEEVESTTLTPADVVARYASGPLPRSAAQTRQLVEQLRQHRHQDDELRTAGLTP